VPFRKAFGPKWGKKKYCFLKGRKSLWIINNQITKMGVAGALRVNGSIWNEEFYRRVKANGGKVSTPSDHLGSSQWIRAKYSGMFHPSIL